jgi:hypothetical protein
MSIGHDVSVWPVFDGYALEKRLVDDPDVTHVVLFAPWMDTPFLSGLVSRWQSVEFVMVCHSNAAFLQADKWSTKIIREEIMLSREAHNFRVGGNLDRFCRFVSEAYNARCQYLPNLYYLDPHDPPTQHPWNGGPIRIGIFGATRPLKNMMSAAAGAILIARRLRSDVEIHVSTGRNEGGGGIFGAVQEMTKELRGIELVELPWQSWPVFRESCRHMHLMLQPSFTETFNIVTADGVSVGTPSVVSPAINWTPRYWRADPDDPQDIARVGVSLLQAGSAASDGFTALTRYNYTGIQAWNAFLGYNPNSWWNIFR